MEQYEKIYLYRRIVRAKLFIDNHYADKIELDSIADQAHFSKFHFIRLFKSIYGKTPNNYLIKVRMDNAKILLEKGHPVSEVSAMVGFDSVTSFAGMFKKIIGQAPSALQKAFEAKQHAIKTNPFLYIPNCFAETNGWTK